MMLPASSVICLPMPLVMLVGMTAIAGINTLLPILTSSIVALLQLWTMIAYAARSHHFQLKGLDEGG